MWLRVSKINGDMKDLKIVQEFVEGGIILDIGLGDDLIVRLDSRHEVELEIIPNRNDHFAINGTERSA